MAHIHSPLTPSIEGLSRRIRVDSPTKEHRAESLEKFHNKFNIAYSGAIGVYGVLQQLATGNVVGSLTEALSVTTGSIARNADLKALIKERGTSIQIIDSAKRLIAAHEALRKSESVVVAPSSSLRRLKHAVNAFQHFFTENFDTKSKTLLTYMLLYPDWYRAQLSLRTSYLNSYMQEFNNDLQMINLKTTEYRCLHPKLGPAAVRKHITHWYIEMMKRAPSLVTYAGDAFPGASHAYGKTLLDTAPTELVPPLKDADVRGGGGGGKSSKRSSGKRGSAKSKAKNDSKGGGWNVRNTIGWLWGGS